MYKKQLCQNGEGNVVTKNLKLGRQVVWNQKLANIGLNLAYDTN
jgi:hypothetical protein